MDAPVFSFVIHPLGHKTVVSWRFFCTLEGIELFLDGRRKYRSGELAFPRGESFRLWRTETCVLFVIGSELPSY